MTVHMQDWSSYQPYEPETAGLDAVMVKATEGTSYINPRMLRQAAHARAAGCVTGFYHFLHPGNITAQAAYFVEKCASVGGDPLWVDWERTGDGTAASCAEKDAFIREVQRLRPDHRVGLYCNRDFWLNRDTTSYSGDGLWIADYNGRPGHPGIEAPWLFHQYTSTPLDLSIGSLKDKPALQAWCGRFDNDGQEDDDMKLSDQVTLGDWVADHWRSDQGVQDGKVQVNTALGSGYAHARAAHDGVDLLRAEVADLKKTLAAILKAVA